MGHKLKCSKCGHEGDEAEEVKPDALTIAASIAQLMLMLAVIIGVVVWCWSLT